MNKETRKSSLVGISVEELAYTFVKGPKNENLNWEVERLSTFSSWPTQSAVDPARLAKSGFYYTGNDDEVLCFSCNGHIKNWQYGDIVQRKHMELFPSCNFVNNKSNNIPYVSPKVSHLSSIVVQNSISSVQKETPNHLPVNGHLSNHLPMNGHLSDRLKEKASSNGNGQYSQNTVHDVKNIEEFKEFKKQRSKINSEICKGMLSEEKRLESFKVGWPLSFIAPLELSRAGFFYLGIGDKVQCPYCKGVVSDWEVGDKPLKEHTRHFPRCPFVIAASNIEHFDRDKNCSWYKNKGFDVCGKDEMLMQSPMKSKHKLLDKDQEHTKLEELGVSLHNGPMHPQQATISARLRSFASWPELVPVKKEDLARAGFFYIGISDHTKCFYCDGGLCSWEPVDDPWVEHARWFRNCNFVRLNKGDDFIKSCIEKYGMSNGNAAQGSSEFENSSMDKNSILLKAAEAMESSMITAVLETGIFHQDLVQTAVEKQIEETGTSFSNLDEVCEAVQYLKQKMAISAGQESIKRNIPSPKDLSIQIQTSPFEETSTESALTKQILPSEETEMKENVTIATKRLNGIDSNLSKDLESDKSLSNQRLCKICMDKEAEVVFLPCRHMLACTLCTTALKDCPLCRVNIQATVTAYIP